MPNSEQSLDAKKIDPDPRVIIDPNVFSKQLKNKSESSIEEQYAQIDDSLNANIDEHFGIKSTLEDRADNGVGAKKVWVRDATQSLPLAERIDPDHPVIEANNTLLRMLSRLRPIDYAIANNQSVDSGLRTKIRDEMKIEFAKMSANILSISQSKDDDTDKLKKMKSAETQFNTLLIQKLHDANLTPGVKNAEDAEDLLAHYRNMSSVLTPARTLVTLTYDNTNKILVRETQYPVTVKTENQKQALDELKTVNVFPTKDEKTAHTRLNKAEQLANSLFAEKIGADDTLLAAQARKTYLASNKNAFIVEATIVFGGQQDDLTSIKQKKADKDDTLWFVRSGAPVYVGKGDEARVQEHTDENFKQIVLNAQQLNYPGDLTSEHPLHVTTLNTNSIVNDQKQATMISHISQANIAFSNVPTNWEGRKLHSVQTSPELNEINQANTTPDTNDSAKANRVITAAQVMLAAAKQGFLSLVHCASGQDRTGTVVMKAISLWIGERCQAKNKSNLSEEVAESYYRGENQAYITSHQITGSRGLKSDSQADAFSAEVEARYYTDSAKTNKDNKVDPQQLGFLNEPPIGAKAEFKTKLAILTAFAETYPALKTPIENLQNTILDLSANAINLHESISVLDCVNKTLSNLGSREETEKNFKTLDKIPEKISGNDSLIGRLKNCLVDLMRGIAKFLPGIQPVIPENLSNEVSKFKLALGSMKDKFQSEHNATNTSTENSRLTR